MKSLLVSFLLLFVVFQAKSQDVIAEWNFSGKVKGNEITSDATLVHENIKKVTLSRGAGIEPQEATYSFASTFPPLATKDEAVSKEAYYEFTVQANEGYAVSLSSIDVTLRVQKNAPKSYRWVYSVDGKKFNPIGSKDVKIKVTDNNGVSQPQIDLTSYKDLQKVPSKTPVVFRLYAWGGNENISNAFRIGKSTSLKRALVVRGEVSEAKK